MRKVDELKGLSCLTNAEDDEPIFTLRANDELASYIVRRWADVYREQKKSTSKWGERQQAKHAEALQLADMMDQWRTEKRAAAEKCATCDGRGEVGGFINMESGYQNDPCPECSTATKDVG